MDNIRMSSIKKAIKINKRKQIVIMLSISIVFLIIITVAGLVMDPQVYAPNYSAKKLSPSLSHLFGTDFLGRDMFSRTIKGLSTSILIGLLAASLSSIIALVLGTLSAVIGGKVDKFIIWCVDLCMGVPHIVMLMLISFMLGGGLKGVIIGVAVTHWPNLTRIVRSEIMQIRSAQYVMAAKKLGKSNWWISKKHMTPHVLPQYIVGLVLLFPHAILHEAAITFLGYGLSLDMPAIGVILSEAMKHLAGGMWWLAFFPGLALLLVVIMFDTIGDNLKTIIDPYSAHE